MTRIIGIAVVLAGVAACKRDEPAVTLSDAVALSAPTTVGTAPMFAVSPKGAETVAWVSAPEGGSDGRLYVSVGSSAPTEIRDTLGPIEPHGESPPKLAYAPDGGLYAIYTVGKLAEGQHFPVSALRLVKSSDDGKTWTSPVTVTAKELWGSHSFHALHVTKTGTVYVSWLGNYEMTAEQKAAMAAVHGAHSAHGPTTSWIARSDDGGATWSTPVRVDQGEACPCCRTSVVSSSDGNTLYMSWRHVFPGNIRDVVVAKSTDRGNTWSEPVRVHADDWKFDACPHAGPAMSIDGNGTIHVAWWTGKEGGAGVYYAQSKDGAATFSPPVALGVAQYSRAAHVQLALSNDDRVIVAWDDGTKAVPVVTARVSTDGGAHFGEAVAVSSEGKSATFPVLSVSGDSVAIAWSESNAAVSSEGAKKGNSAPRLRSVGDAQVLLRRGVLPR